jgi:HAMP domain-containing protein
MILEIIMSCIAVTFGYTTFNLTRKVETLETWVENFSSQVNEVQTELENVDQSGAFESDDEVGAIFSQIKELVKQLEQFRGEELNARS